MAKTNPLKLKKIRSRGPLADKVYGILKKAIIEGTIEPGIWLQEEHVTNALGTSRTPVREAFNRLKSDGLIEIVPRKGAYIIELSDAELDDLFEAREVIETTFFERSVQALPKEVFVGLKEKLSDAERIFSNASADQEEWHEARINYLKTDRELHDILIKATNNKYWEQLYFNIRDRIEMFGNQLSLDEKWFSRAMQEHHAIIDAVLAEDITKAQKALAVHIKNVRQGIDRIRDSSIS